jgi:hypothetical protein
LRRSITAQPATGCEDTRDRHDALDEVPPDRQVFEAERVADTGVPIVERKSFVHTVSNCRPGIRRLTARVPHNIAVADAAARAARPAPI